MDHINELEMYCIKGSLELKLHVNEMESTFETEDIYHKKSRTLCKEFDEQFFSLDRRYRDIWYPNAFELNETITQLTEPFIELRNEQYIKIGSSIVNSFNENTCDLADREFWKGTETLDYIIKDIERAIGEQIKYFAGLLNENLFGFAKWMGDSNDPDATVPQFKLMFKDIMDWLSARQAAIWVPTFVSIPRYEFNIVKFQLDQDDKLDEVYEMLDRWSVHKHPFDFEDIKRVAVWAIENSFNDSRVIEELMMIGLKSDLDHLNPQVALAISAETRIPQQRLKDHFDFWHYDLRSIWVAGSLRKDQSAIKHQLTKHLTSEYERCCKLLNDATTNDEIRDANTEVYRSIRVLLLSIVKFDEDIADMLELRINALKNPLPPPVNVLREFEELKIRVKEFFVHMELESDVPVVPVSIRQKIRPFRLTYINDCYEYYSQFKHMLRPDFLLNQANLELLRKHLKIRINSLKKSLVRYKKDIQNALDGKERSIYENPSKRMRLD